LPLWSGGKDKETDRALASIVKSTNDLTKKVEEMAKKVEDDRKLYRAIGEKVLKLEKEGVPVDPAFEESITAAKTSIAQIKGLEARVEEIDNLLRKSFSDLQSVTAALQSLQAEVQGLRSEIGVALPPPIEPPASTPQPTQTSPASPPASAPMPLQSGPRRRVRGGVQLVEVNPRYIKLSLTRLGDGIVKSVPVENQLAAKKAVDEAIPAFMKIYNKTFGREQTAFREESQSSQSPA
jgi:hypothetical protein